MKILKRNKERQLEADRRKDKWRRRVLAGYVGRFWEPLPQFFHTIRSIQMWEPSITDLLILYSPKFLNPPTPKKSICPLDPHHGDAFTGLTNMYVSPILHMLALRRWIDCLRLLFLQKHVANRVANLLMGRGILLANRKKDPPHLLFSRSLNCEVLSIQWNSVSESHLK